MDRRDFLTISSSKKKIVLTPQDPTQRTTSGLNPYTGVWSENEVIHLLKRTMFGARRLDIDYFKSKTMNQSVDELLNPTAPLPNPPVKDYDTSGSVTTPDTNILQGNTWVNDPNNDGTINSRRRASFKKWWMGLMINQDRSIREKLNLFWHNFFATETNEIGNAQYVYKHHNLLRSSCLGNYKTLIKDITLDPAMLVYLNGQLNTATAPDENYGRELQELFTVGKDGGAPYTENDVKEASKVLSGWRNNSTTFSAYFTASRHNTTNKVFSSFYNNTTIVGRSDATAGDVELNELLNMIFNTQEVAKHVCRRLYRWFVYYEIDANTENNIIVPLANIFRTNNYEIKPVLNTLFKSEHFFDVLNQSCLIKSPLDLMVGLCREFNVVFPDSSDYISNYGLWNWLVNYGNNMQQNLGDPPDVAGWKAYYQVPQFHEIWINSDTLPKRNQFTDTMMLTGYTFNSKKIIVDAAEYAKTLSNPGDPNVLITDLLKYIFRIDISLNSKNQIKKDILLAGQAQDYYWTNVWVQFINNPSDTANTNLVKARVRDLIKYLMNLAEYQLA
jgi:uncharacterized protein (DUF1800 family)